MLRPCRVTEISSCARRRRQVNQRFPTMPFTLRAGDERNWRMGVVECVKHNLFTEYPVLFDKVQPTRARRSVLHREARVRDCGALPRPRGVSPRPRRCVQPHATPCVPPAPTPRAQDGTFVAQFKFTVMLLPSGNPARLTTGPAPDATSELAIEDEGLKELLAVSTEKKKKNKPKKKKGGGGGDKEEPVEVS
eukprot:3899987-Prymnesium_polylepis.1